VNNKLKKLNLKNKKIENIKNKFKYEYDRLELNKEIFTQVWKEFGHGFYDPKMHDLNWEKEYKIFSAYLQYAFTPEILNWIVSEMIGRVNASHTGFYPRNDENGKYFSQAFGGFTVDLKNYPKEGLRINKIYRIFGSKV
jgi:tricorn protease